MKTSITKISVLSTLLACIATPAMALPTLGRHLTGTIEKIDLRIREVEMRRADKGTDVTFGWNRRTTFSTNGHPADATILKPGTRAKVIYHTPFIGKPFVSRVRIVAGSQPGMPSAAGESVSCNSK